MRNEKNVKDMKEWECPYCFQKVPAAAYGHHLKVHLRECPFCYDRVERWKFEKHLKEKHPNGGGPPAQGGLFNPR